MKTKLSIIIPMYNEEEIISDTASALSSLADKYSSEFDFEILFVNDGSKDNSVEKAEQSVKNDDRFIVTGYLENGGKGKAVRFGMLHSSGDIRVFTDCDLAYGTEAIVSIAKQMLKDKADITIGSRNLSSDGYASYTFIRRFMSKTYIKVISIAAGFRHTDSQSGIKCFLSSAAQNVFSKCEVNRFAFDLEALMIAEKLGYKVSEMPVTIINHRESRSKVNPIKDTLRMLKDIIKIKKRIKFMKEDDKID